MKQIVLGAAAYWRGHRLRHADRTEDGAVLTMLCGARETVSLGNLLDAKRDADPALYNCRRCRAAETP